MDKPAHLFDRRTVERNIAAGLVTEEEYKAFLDGLDDDAEHGVESKTAFEHKVRLKRLEEEAEDDA